MILIICRSQIESEHEPNFTSLRLISTSYCTLQSCFLSCSRYFLGSEASPLCKFCFNIILTLAIVVFFCCFFHSRFLAAVLFCIVSLEE